MNAIPKIAIGVPAGQQCYKKILLVLAVLFLSGAGSFTYMLATMPELIPWSFFVASFVYLLGISQFGIAFSAIMRICKVNWARPFYRLSEIATLAFFPFAIILFLLIYTYGREHLFFWMSPEPGQHLSPWLNSNFFLIRNLFVQLLFYGLATVYFLMGLIPDITSDSAGNSEGWCGGFYRWLWKQKQRRDVERLKSNMFLFAPIVLIVAVVANTIVAWDFGMMLFPHYHSTIFPMYWILGNMLAGAAAILMLGAVTCRTLKLQNFFKTEQLRSMGIVFTCFALLWLYMFWSQFFVTWFGNLPYETGPLWTRMFGHYAPYFWIMIFCVFWLPFGALIVASVKRNWWSLLSVAAVINVGIWLNRYLLIVPAKLEDHTPFSSLPELILVVGLFSGFLLMFLLSFKIFPMISTWEMQNEVGEEDSALPS